MSTAPTDTVGETLAPFLLRRLAPLSAHRHIALAAIPRKWLRAVPGIGHTTIAHIDALAGAIVGRDTRAQAQCDALRRAIVAYDLGAIPVERLGLPIRVAATLRAAGYADLDAVMRAPDADLRRLPGLGPKLLRRLRWARILHPLDRAVSRPSSPSLCTDREWDEAAPRSHPVVPITPRAGAGARA